jgi:hypothetical protein
LNLYSKGKEIVSEFISPTYDLKLLSDVAKFLHSTIQMHCLLQEELDDKICVRLFKPLPCSSGGEVVVYPGLVRKVVIPPLDQAKMKFMYDSIAGSRYLIQLKSVWSTRKNTTMQLEPVGDPHARPVVLRDLENAIHDMLHSLVDLHKAGYTHRDLRWENCIKL